MSNILVVQDDIVVADVDAIVNAAKPNLTGGSGVDGAIHRAAGNSLLSECLKIELINNVRCPTGEARITSAGNLSAKYVIHTVGPVYNGSKLSSEMLESCYENCIQLALDNNCSSIAFPAISCGKYGYPYEEASKIAIGVCRKYLSENLSICFYILDPIGVKFFSKEFNH